MTAARQSVHARSALWFTNPKARRATWACALAAYLGGASAIAHSSNYEQSLLLVAAVYSVLALSLDLVAGATGLYSLGHAGLFAIGAYTTTILNTHYGWNVFLALPVVVAAVGIVGVVIGALSLRVSGLYFAITTLIFTIIVNVLVSDLSITGGYQGLPGPTFPNFPHALSPLGSALVWAVAGAVLLTITVTWSIRSSALYPALLAIRDSEPFASSVGVRTAATKVAIFSLSAALAGLAGWTFSFLGFITPGQFDTTAAVNILVMVILGGMNTRTGPIFGAVFIGLFPTVVTINPLWQEILFGSIFLIVIVFFPGGFVGLLARAGREIRAKATHTGEAQASVAPGTRPSHSNGSAPDEPREVTAPFRPSVGIDLRATLGSSTAAAREREAVSEIALEVHGVSFSYVKGTKVLDGVDFVVRRGTVHGLIGPNGSGKSTLVNLISGELPCQEGAIRVNGRRIDHLPAWQRPAVGLMRTFQTAGMVSELTLRDNVGLGLFSHLPRIGPRSLAWPLLPSARRDDEKVANIATAALGRVGLEEPWPGSRALDVPHGVEQLAQLAAACVGAPRILVLDEPLAGLSRQEVDQVAAILRDLKAQGVSTIVVEHQARFIFEVCDEVTVLAAGELVKAGSAAEVRSDERVRQVYLGL
ncbi:MAG TPA: ATP-binding cassette domain-containing protein [Acidimicrobiales bacterium]|nr:ATP-binding cassette domain-containing protein [Acidimicrobiales bacterium]